MNEKSFCMSEFLMYRYLYDSSINWGLPHHNQPIDFERLPVRDANDLIEALAGIVENATREGKAALALSGGIDSAILAKMMPKGSTAYTFRCVVPGIKLTDESEIAAHYAKLCNLKHVVIDIYWEDVERVVDRLMIHKGAPIHSIEAQIYLASCRAGQDGFSDFIFGENADIIYGGMNGLLEKDWLYGEFVERYSYVLPFKVLKEPMMPLTPFSEYEKDGHIDGHDFINKYFRQEALGTYHNACETAGMNFVGPYSQTELACDLDYQRIRSGDTKYVVREAFKKLYPDENVPPKIPMPRPVNEWFAYWKGPTRSEFLPHCTDDMKGDQKWMVWCLERYLNLMEETK